MAFTDVISSLRGRGPGASFKYTALPTSTTEDRPVYRQASSRYYADRHRKFAKTFIGGTVLVVILFMMISYGRSRSEGGCEATANCTDVSQHVWGQYSPYFSAPSDIDPSTPDECELTFGLVLSRHGSRYPTAGKSLLYKAAIERIKSSITAYAPGFQFLEEYNYTLGADHLTLFGEAEMARSGDAFYDRYKDLLSDSEPFIRAAGSERVIASAKYFTEALYIAHGKKPAGPIADILIIPEKVGYNNTMNGGMCPAFENGPAAQTGHKMQRTWAEQWVPSVTDRLNRKLPGANLSLEETIFMMDLCPFNTIASAEGTHSDFCRLFSEDEWYSYDYYESLDKWYSHGSGNHLGPTQGIGYVNELIARLTGKAVVDHTTTNSTLDSSPETFPLDRRLYADFSHDNTMASIYGALGLYAATEDLPATHRVPPKGTRGYSAAWTVSFAARMYVEKMRCGKAGEELVRVLVNDRVVPLNGCGADELGRCKLGEFVESLSFARSGGLWDECFT